MDVPGTSGEDSSGSEVDDIAEDYVPEISDHETGTDTDISDTETTTQPLLQTENISCSLSDDEDVPLSRLCYFRRKNKYKWSKSPPNRSSVRTPQHNIILRVPTSKLTESDEKDPYSIWKQFIDDDILLEVMTRTNSKLSEYRSEYANPNRAELQNVDIIELHALLLM
ncbi:hypothetical protein ACJJTC_010693 [Scirpophaga incertulas]